ncbi:MAG: NUDIX domain-containing protein [bacterium]|nr:NUDIX domain-containing protein [bacterium]
MRKVKDKSYGVIPVLQNRNGDEYKFLVVQSLATDEWVYPKGHKENGESELDAAKRELSEETGLSCDILPTLRYEDTYEFDKDGISYEKTVTYYVGLVIFHDVTIQKNEIKDYKWVTYDQALGLLSFDRSKEILMQVKRDIAGLQK